LNPEAETLLGVAQGQEQNQLSFREVISPETSRKLQEQMAAAPDEAARLKFDHIDIVRGKGAATPVRLTGSRLQSEGLELYVLALADITNELRTKSVIERQVQVRTEELHQARAYLVDSLNSLEQGFILVNQQGEIELVNGMSEHLSHTSDQKLVGQPLTRALKSLKWDIDLMTDVKKVLAGKGAQRLNASTEKGMYYTVFITPIVSSGQVLGAAVIIEDVTEDRILERSKDEFFSIASHELRTPLTAIRGNMSMIRDYFPKAMKDEGLATAINDAHDASIRLIKIVNDFLDSSRLEQGRMVFHLQPTKVDAVVEKVGKDLAPIFKTQHNTLKLKNLTDLPEVYVDGERIGQILYDLLDNAAKYCDHGTITVTAGASGRMLRILVTDTGKGISPEGQNLLFHKFQQTSDSILTRDNTRSTGMGLYIAKLMATNMGGDVTLGHSALGKGSTFVIALPLATKAQITKAAKAAKAEPTAKA
jgi:signal transduction histidine kinase